MAKERFRCSDKELKEKRVEYKKVIEKQTLCQKVSEAIKVLQQSLSEDSVAFVQEFLTLGLQTVYPERGFQVYLDVGDRATRKTLEIFIRSPDKDGNVITSHLTKGSGGGIQVIVAVLLQVLTIRNRDLQRVIFLDEALSAVSSEYLPGLRDLIQTLKEEFGFKFLAITQDPRFIELADKTYKVENGRFRLRET